jgi:hypothetical protein
VYRLWSAKLIGRHTQHSICSLVQVLSPAGTFFEGDCGAGVEPGCTAAAASLAVSNNGSPIRLAEDLRLGEDLSVRKSEVRVSSPGPEHFLRKAAVQELSTAGLGASILG